MDGNRLDLHVCTLDYVLDHLEIYQILVDKDHRLPKPYLSASIYNVKKPTEKQFECTCMEFWWCLNNATKGLWRDEIPYVMDAVDDTLRPELRKLLEWKIGIEHDFQISVGKSGKYMKKYLTDQEYQQYLSTYTVAQKDSVIYSILTMCDLFNTTAKFLSQQLHYAYDNKQAQNSLYFFKHVMLLDKDAKALDQ